jgi:tRNA nucleotidyltransferase/poly(A) polymerase
MKEVAMQRHKFDIPVPQPVQKLHKVFSDAGFGLYAVGGYVRDFLLSHFHSLPFKSKDVDVVTDAVPSEVASVLKKAGIRCFEKGEAFGVMVAHLDGEDFEIATMRSDGAEGDGRHPDKVTYTRDMEADHYRRDLTINGLFYDMGTREVLDYSSGMNDVALKKVRTIGDPWRRLGEDRLRILRLVRFYHRFNDAVLDGSGGQLCSQTYSAMHYYRRLNCSCLHHLGQRTLQPISKERIQQEFVAGLKQSVDTSSFLLSLYALDLMDEVFPELHHYRGFARQVGNCKNVPVVLATLLRDVSRGNAVKAKLLEAKWPAEVFDLVAFIVGVNQTCRLWMPPDSDMVKAALVLRNRPGYRDNLKEFIALVPDSTERIHHLCDYEIPEFKGEEITQKYGIQPGKDMGQKIRELQVSHYLADRSIVI